MPISNTKKAAAIYRSLYSVFRLELLSGSLNSLNSCAVSYCESINNFLYYLNVGSNGFLLFSSFVLARCNRYEHSSNSEYTNNFLHNTNN